VTGPRADRPGRADQADEFQPPQRLVLVVAVGQPTVHRLGVGGSGADRVPRAEAPDERVGPAATAVRLHREIDLADPAEEVRRCGHVRTGGRCRLVHAGGDRQDAHTVDRAGPAGEQFGMGRRAQQHDLGVRIRVAQRPQGRQSEYQVTEATTAQHRDPAHTGQRGAQRSDVVRHRSVIPLARRAKRVCRWPGRASARMDVDVLIPTRNRPGELATTLGGLAAQDGPGFRVVISDQSDGPPSYESPPAEAMIRQLRRTGHPVSLHTHLPRRGMAEQRQFLLDRADSGYVLFLDDDVWLEPGTLRRLHSAISALRCGFVGCAMQGLSYLDDERPHELARYREWRGPVEPERITPDSAAFDRWRLHNAANLVHLARRLDIPAGEWRAYRVAWIAGCVLFDHAKLLACGGFDFWPALPPEHAGEDVAAQWRVMARYGGAGVLPSGAVHLESPTTVPDRRVQATDVVLT
jgi:Glycosyl transferase family 2